MNVIVFDTETTGELDCPFAYDLGYAVLNLESSAILKTESLVISEIFNDEEMMASAYYAEKIPLYREALRKGERKMVTCATAKRMLTADCKRYNVHYLSAHNARFDYRSTATTQRYLTCSKYRFFLPYGCELIDTLKMARLALKANDEYGEFCYNNDYLTKRGCRRYTAEILYRFISGDNEFVEAHQGLDDVMIEKDILLYCLRNGLTVTDGLLW